MFSLSTNISNKFPYLSKCLEGKIDYKCRCEQCGNIIKNKEDYINLVFEISNINCEMPDKLLYGGAGAIVVSKRTIDCFIDNKITGFEYFPVKILYNSKNISEKYYIIYITGKGEFAYKKMHIKDRRRCEKCGKLLVGRPQAEFTYLDEEKIDNTDFIMDDIVSQRVIDVIKKNNLSGFAVSDVLYYCNPIEKAKHKIIL
jgi:hypothetical protein